MNISQVRLSDFKHELLPMLYLFLTQLWWSFNFPQYVKLGAHWNIFLAITMSVAVVFLYLWIVLNAEKYALRFNVEYPDKTWATYIMRNFGTICPIVMGHIVMFYVWYNDSYVMSDTYYLLFYVHGLIVSFLFYRVSHREHSRKQRLIAE